VPLRARRELLVGVPLVVTRTRVDAAPDQVWARVTTPDGINAELRPIMRMTMPRRWAGASIADLTPGEHVGRSWLLLGGVVPFEFDDLTVAEIGPGHRFLEISEMAMYSAWTHERTVTADGDGAVVTDAVGFVLRRPLRWVPGVGGLHRAVLQRTFRHRHGRLRAAFGGGPTEQHIAR
jgi:ligand-binding SRPBCC domain-containing protein